MLESLHLVNFRKHKKLFLKFQKGTNCIVGPTDAGKSTILLALRFIGLNIATRKSAKSVADPHIMFGADYCKVILKVDGHTIVRRKGKNGNYYRLDGGKPYHAIGNRVPDSIHRLLNLQPINWQRQLDLPFWFSDSAGQVSKHLNTLVNLDSMDRALSNVNNKLRNAKAEVTFISERIKEARSKKQELSWVPEFQTGVDRLTTLDTDHITIVNKRDSLSQLIKVGVTHWQTQNSLKNATIEGKNLVVQGDKLTSIRQRRESLKRLIDDCVSADRLKSIQVPDLSSILVIRKEGDQIAEQRRELEMMIEKANQLEKDVCQSQKQLTKAIQELKQCQEGKICPTCQRPL